MRLQNRAWEKGLKTGIYYLRTKPPASPIPYGLLSRPGTPTTECSDEPPPLEDVVSCDGPPPLEEAASCDDADTACCDA